MLPQLDEVERRRRNLALSQKELSRLAGVSQSLIAKIEAGKISPSYLKTKAIFDTLESLERKRDVRAHQLMQTKIIGVQAHESVSKAIRLMGETGFSQLPVFSGKQVVGSITEKTLVESISKGKNLEEISKLPVERIMEKPFVTLDENTPISVVSNLLQHDQAVLASNRGQVTGIITKADLLRMGAGRRPLT